jgi:hypothetical protein
MRANFRMAEDSPEAGHDASSGLGRYAAECTGANLWPKRRRPAPTWSRRVVADVDRVVIPFGFSQEEDLLVAELEGEIVCVTHAP